MNRKLYILLGLIVLVGVGGIGVAKANPSYFTRCQSAAATSTLAYMSPGAGTTTLAIPATGCGGVGAGATDSAYLTFQYTASSTAPTLNVRIEHSQDGIDWYPESIALAANATSTQMSGDSATFKFIMATSTDNGGSGTASRLMRSLFVQTPTLYTRAVFSVPTGGGNGALWASFIAKQQGGQ